MKRSENAIRWQIDACDDSDLAGMTYEEGVKAALEWVLGDTQEKPVEE